jgi:hypothetical protein
MDVGTLSMATDSLVFELRIINKQLFCLQQRADFQDPIDNDVDRVELALDSVTKNFDFLINVVADKRDDEVTKQKMKLIVKEAIFNELAMKLREHIEATEDNFDFLALKNCTHILENKKQLQPSHFQKRLEKKHVDDDALVEMFLYLTYLYVSPHENVTAHVVQDLRSKRELCDELAKRLANFKINHKLWI